MSCRARHRTTRHGISFFCLPLPLRASVFMCVCAYRCKNHLFLTQLGLLGSFFNASLFRLMSFLSLSSLYLLCTGPRQPRRPGTRRNGTVRIGANSDDPCHHLHVPERSILYFCGTALCYVRIGLQPSQSARLASTIDGKR